MAKTAARLRRGPRWAVPLAAVVIALLAAVPVLAALSPSTFDATDANLVNNGGEKDWADFPAGTTPKADKPTGQSDDSFGTGTKEDTEVPSITDGSIPNNKSDLSNFYVASETLGPTDHFLYLGWSRVQDPSGTTNMDFELNQSRTPSTNGVTPVRTAGDVLIKYDLSRGGSVPSIGIHRWLTTGASSACEASSSLPCWGKLQTLSASQFEASINSGPVGNLMGGTYSARTFGEAAIDLEASGIFGGGCLNFGSAYLKSRSSDSFTSAIKDFVAPTGISVNSCPDDEVKLRKIDKVSGANLSATMQLWKDVNGSGVIDTGDIQVAPRSWTSGSLDCQTAVSDGIGSCVFDITTSGTYIARESVPPAGYQSAPDQVQVVNIENKTFDTFTLTFEDMPEPGDLTVRKVDTSTPGVALPGAKFQLWRDVNANGTLETATDTKLGAECTTGAGGECLFAALLPGRYLVQETAAPPGYDLPAGTVQAVTISTGTGNDVTVTFVDPPTKGSVTVVKREAGDPDSRLAGATFVLYRDVDGDGVLDKPGDTQAGTCTTGVLGVCSFNALEPGKYLVEETVAPPGYDLPDPAYKAVTVTVKAGGDQVSITFDDPPTPGRITVVKTDDSSPAVRLQGAKFQLWNDVDGDGTLDASGPDTKAGAECTTSAAGECVFGDLALGRYLVQETQAPAGYSGPSSAVQAATITKQAGGASVTVTFVNPRKFNVVVLVCQDGGASAGKLYSSTVEFDGSTKNSLRAGDLPSGVSEAEACSLAGARYTGKAYGSYPNASVTIGQSPQP